MIFSLVVTFGWFFVGATCSPWVRNRAQWFIVDLFYCVVCLLVGAMFYGFKMWLSGPLFAEKSFLERVVVAVVGGLVALTLPGMILLVRQHLEGSPLQFGRLVLVRPPVAELCLLIAVAIAEEVVFRGVLIYALTADGLGGYQSTMVSWGLFCLVHLGWKKAAGFGDVAVAGAVICAVFLVVGLIGGIMVHCLYNISTTVFRLRRGEGNAPM